MKAEENCANCGMSIQPEENYLIVGDNFLQVKFFDSREDNIFCSKECLCQALSVLEVDSDGEAYEI